MKAKVAKDPGLGTKFKTQVPRMMNADGSYNIKRIGGLSKFQDFYKFLVECSWIRFLIYITAFYIVVNFLFTFLYMAIGVEELKGISDHQSRFFAAFFFSAQTFTTVGYGAIAPNGFSADIVAMIESFTGLMSFAIATGLLYARFSRPRTKIAFSKNIIITPFDGATALMFKMVNTRRDVLLNTRVNVMLIHDKGGGQDAFNKQYFELKLENDEVNFFPLTWTIVHKIDADSPIYGMNVSELIHKNAEVVILIETFDETYSQNMLQKHSYAQDQWIENVKFDTNFRTNEKGEIELYVNEIDNLLPIG